MYDLLIIGSGPAGMSAAVYAQRAKLHCAVIEKLPMGGGQILNTYEVDNYPGIPKTSGFELGTQLRKHAEAVGTEFIQTEVQSIEKNPVRSLQPAAHATGNLEFPEKKS